MNRSFQSLAGIILLGAVVTGCASSKITPESKQDRAYASLNCLYYPDNPAPADITHEEKQDTSTLLASMQDEEREFLENRFGDDLTLISYALRDTDGDGLVDYRINSDSRFIENDTDVDGDGVFNVRDAQPYDTAITFDDTNDNTVPDHIDWALAKDKKDYAFLQEKTLKEFDMIMVERDSKFTRELAQSNYDLIYYIFWPVFDRLKERYPGTYPALHTMASSSRADHSVAIDQQSVLADMSGINATISYYDLLDKDPEYKTILQLQTMAHELAHAVEFSMDTTCPFPVDTTACTDTAFLRMKKYNVFYAQNYYEFVEKAGWTVNKTSWEAADEPLEQLTQSYSCKHVFKHIADHECYYVPYTEQYGTKTSEEWQKELTYLWNNEEYHKDFFEHKLLTDNYLPDDYAVTESWEWFPQYASHYMLYNISETGQKQCESEGKSLGRELIDGSWYTLSADFNNIRGNKEALELIGPLFKPKDDQAWNFFTKNYLFHDYPNICK